MWNPMQVVREYVEDFDAAELHLPVTFISVLGALAATSIVVARSGHANVWRTVGRSLLIGAVAMALTATGGELLD